MNKSHHLIPAEIDLRSADENMNQDNNAPTEASQGENVMQS